MLPDHSVWGFFVADGTGLEQQQRRPRPAAETGRNCWGSVLIFQGPAKGLKKNQQTQPVRRHEVTQAISPVRLLLSPRWPTARNVYQERTKAGYHHGGGALPFCFVFPYIALFGLIAAYIHTWSVRTYAGKRAGSDI